MNIAVIADIPPQQAKTGLAGGPDIALDRRDRKRKTGQVHRARSGWRIEKEKAWEKLQRRVEWVTAVIAVIGKTKMSAQPRAALPIQAKRGIAWARLRSTMSLDEFLCRAYGADRSRCSFGRRFKMEPFCTGV